MQLTPITPTLGATIEGVDLHRCSAGEIAALRTALLRHKVLFVRDQRLDLDQLHAASARFGDLMKLPYIAPTKTHPAIIEVRKEADEINMGVFGGDWHSDFSFLSAPPALSILMASEIPEVGGDTLWADMAAAYKHLPAALKAEIEGTQVVHTGAPYGSANAPPLDTQFTGSMRVARNNPEADAEIVHPTVRRHPESGEPALFLNPTYTTRFAHQSNAASAELLGKLFAHCTRPEFTCRFRWTPNCVAIWDNRNTLHYAVNDYDGHRRVMYRTTIAGDTPLSWA